MWNYWSKQYDGQTDNCLFFQNSPKRNGLLVNIMETEIQHTGKRKPLTDLCRKRWAERHEAYTDFYNSYQFIVKSLEVIVYGMHREQYSKDFTGAKWDTKSKREACGLLAAITSFDFIISFMTIYQFLSHLEGITVKIQSTSLDILKAYGKYFTNVGSFFMLNIITE